MGTRIQMVATTAGGSENALATIDVPRNGTIISVSWTGNASYDTTADNCRLQLSFGSVITDANDSRQVISNANYPTMNVLTAVGGILGVLNYWDEVPEIPVSMGERLFIHAVSLAGFVSTTRVLIGFSFDLDQALVRRR